MVRIYSLKIEGTAAFSRCDKKDGSRENEESV